MFHFEPQSYYSTSSTERLNLYPRSYFPEQSLPVSAPLRGTRFSPAPLPSYVNAAAARERYIRALADAKAAEEEMLAAEALQTEENVLRRRLQEIAEQKRLLSTPVEYPGQSLAFARPVGNSSERYRHHDLASLRREIEMEEARQREETEYRDLLRRKEALILARISQQPGDEPLRAQHSSSVLFNDACCAPTTRSSPMTLKAIHEKLTPATKSVPTIPQCYNTKRSAAVKETAAAAPQGEVKTVPEQSHGTLVFDAGDLFKAIFGGALAQSTAKPAPAKTSSPANEPDSRLSYVDSIEASFRKLQSEFSFPPEITFNDSPSDAHPISKLSYSSTNKPIREYEQALSKLVSQLDEISSHGNEKLRLRRKETVLAIEKTIQDLEGEVEQRWATRLTEEPAAPESVIPEEAPAPESEPANPDASVGEEVPQVDEETSAPTESSVPATSSTSQTAYHAEDVEPSQPPEAPATPDFSVPEPAASADDTEGADAVPSEVETDVVPTIRPTEDEHTSANVSLDQSGIFGVQTAQMNESQEGLVHGQQDTSESDWTEVEA